MVAPIGPQAYELLMRVLILFNGILMFSLQQRLLKAKQDVNQFRILKNEIMFVCSMKI